MRSARLGIVIAVSLVTWACGGSDDDGAQTTPTTADAGGAAEAGSNAAVDAGPRVLGDQSVGGTVTGLAGRGLVLQINGGDDLAVDADGVFTFPTGVRSETPFTVTVKTQPSSPTQTCTVENGTGTVAYGPVAYVAVTCTTVTRTLSVNVAGLATGQSVVLQNGGKDDLTVNANGPASFATPVASGTVYALTVKTQPAGAYCKIDPRTGGVDDKVNIAVTCAAVKSCKEILAADANAPSGVYSLGDGATTYSAYCDQTNDGGGWTLALKGGLAAGSKLDYDNAMWTDTTTFGTDSPDLASDKEAKLASFNGLAVTAVRVSLVANGITGGFSFASTGTSLRAIFAGGTAATTGVTRNQWVGAIEGSGLQPNCNNLQGFNLTGGNGYAVRLGMLGNNEDFECNSTDSAIGFGLKSGTATVGASGAYGRVNIINNPVADGTNPAFGYVFVR